MTNLNPHETNLIIYGAGGRLGRLVVHEAVSRDIAVTAAVRDPDRHAELAVPGVDLVRADATDQDSVAAASQAHDAAIASLYQETIPHDIFYASATHGLLEGLAAAAVPRLVMVGAAPNLETRPGVRLMDEPDFRSEYLPFAYGHAAALHVLRAASRTSVDWLVLTPPFDLKVNGDRTGAYLLGENAVVVGPEGPASLSYADLAIALVDEALSPTRHQTRAAVAEPSVTS